MCKKKRKKPFVSQNKTLVPPKKNSSQELCLVFHFGPVYSFWLLPPLWNLLRPSALFHLNFLLLPPYHQEKEPSSRFRQDLSCSGTSVTLSTFLSFLFFFPLRRNQLLRYFTFFSCPFSSSFSSSSSAPATFQLVLERFLGPLPGSFSFLFVLHKKLSHPISFHNSHKSASSSI